MFGKPTPHIKRISYDNIYMRSSYETKFAYFLDLSGVLWQYESKIFDLGNTTYTPDFTYQNLIAILRLKAGLEKSQKEN